MYHYHPVHNEASAAARIGVRMVMGVAMFSWDVDLSIRSVEDALRRWHGHRGIIRVSPAPHAPYTVSPDLWREASRLRDEGDERYGDMGRVVLTSHILEDWREPGLVREKFGVEVPEDSIYLYLDRLGVLSPYFVASHSIHMNDRDFEIVSKRGVKVVHVPVANLKLGMGIANIPRLLDGGVVVGIGTDGPASNNTLDIIESMKVAALLQKGLNRDPTLLPAESVYKMATYDGARALGYDDLGFIRPGYLADIILVDRNAVNLAPLHSVYSHMVYALRPCNVDTVIVNGDIVLENRVLRNIDLEDLLRRVERRASELRESVS
jgi:5-methylthioadenosine/S-adenosylhomocysteine deaminase